MPIESVEIPAQEASNASSAIKESKKESAVLIQDPSTAVLRSKVKAQIEFYFSGRKTWTYSTFSIIEHWDKLEFN